MNILESKSINAMDYGINVPTDSLIENIQRILIWAETIDKEVRARGLQNEQWFLDFQDKLNELSVK